MDSPVAKRKYTADEKRQLIANLDIEGVSLFWHGVLNLISPPQSHIARVNSNRGSRTG